MTDEKKPPPVPFEFDRMTDAEAIEFVKQLDLPREAFALAYTPSLTKIRDLTLTLIGRMEFSRLNERNRQAEVLWEAGIGRELGYSGIQAYLATIPEPRPNPDPKRFDRLVLADRRLQLHQMCRLLNVAYHLNAAAPLLQDADLPPVEFIWCQDGRRDHYRSGTIDERITDGERGMSAVEGLCLYAQQRTVLHLPDNLDMALRGTRRTTVIGEATAVMRRGVSGCTDLDFYSLMQMGPLCGFATCAT